MISAPPYWAYRAFKYAIYGLLVANIYFFFVEEHAASVEVFVGGVGWREISDAYSATIDTLAWVILLLLFELETSTIPDERLQGSLKWVLTGLRTVCFIVIALAFFGYWAKYALLSTVVTFSSADACELVNAGFSYVVSLNNYAPVDANSCLELRGQVLQRIDGTLILGTSEVIGAVTRLAIIDIVNAGTWLIVVAILEVEIYLQLSDRLTDRLVQWNTYIKTGLYSLLLFCAIYWGLLGDFLDFWDAFLWLGAFVFIEMNMFEWHQETAEEARVATP